MDLKSILKTTSKFISTLNNNGITTPKQFFQYFPRTYEDRTQIKTLNQVITDWSIQIVKWIIISKAVIRTPTWKRLIEMILQDENDDKAQLHFLNADYVLKWLKLNHPYIIAGKPKLEKGKFQFRHPELTLSEDIKWFNIWRIFPIYPELLWIKPVWFAKKIRENLDKISELFPETLPKEFLKQYELIDLPTTITSLHFPDSFNYLKNAKYRIFFERLLTIQLISLLNKLRYQEQIENKQNLWNPDRNLVKEITEKIPFQLTNAQKKATKQIIDDFYTGKPMLRLLQWDVGSWKTVVSAITAYYMIKKFWTQIAFLAPTEVLANQHIISLSKILLPLWIRLELLTWSTTTKNKEIIKTNLITGKIDLIIWTHALLQENVEFQNLWFAIVDEQHKFWVMQRAFFKKFWSPHILQMTATPIPRSLTLAFFWEFDISIIDEMPVGRKPIHTKIITTSEWEKLKPWILTKISQNQKLYIITPLIEESEKMNELQSATQEFEDIKQLLPEIQTQIWLLHGRLNSKDKDKIMKDFKIWKLKVLVSTTVIEVWIDVPEATIMIVKNAERFGLSQLHQLRGRVWRSDIQSYCFLQTKSKWWDSYKRLKAMEKSNDWFKLAELDLEMRWSWEILWFKQSWETDIPMEILSNIKFLEKIQEASKQLLEKYPNLDGLDTLKNEINNKWNNVLI